MSDGPRPQIRRATEDDIPQLLDCLRVAFAPYRADYTPGAYLDTVLTTVTARERLDSMVVVVAVTPSGEVLGTVAASRVSEIEGHLRGMAVLPRLQGSGIARDLLQRALDELGALGCRRVTLDTTAPLARAARFYERNGFRPSGKTTVFYGMTLREYVREL